MGEVLLKYKITPEGIEVDLEKLQGSIKAAMPSFAKLNGCVIKPFAFGLKILETTLIVEDEEGNNDKIEEILQGIEFVQGVDLLDMGRI